MLSSCAPKVSVVWTEGEVDPATGRAIHTLTVLNAPEGTGWGVWMTSNYICTDPAEGTEGHIRHYHGCLYKMTPAERSGADLVVKYADIPLQRHCWAPEGFVLELPDGKVRPLKVKYEFLPAPAVPDFHYNQVETNAWDMIPSLKEVTPSEGVTVVEQMPQVEYVQAGKAGWYRITLDGSCRIEAADEDGAQYARVTFENLKRNVGSSELPDMVIEDWPDLGYRGFMLDISRNFTSKDNILRFIDLLAHYKANVLHLHFADDEAWRIEISKFPELTSYTSYHEFPYKDENGEYAETNHLMPSFSGGIDPEDMSSSNGHLTKEDYLEILKYAWERRISVIPEFDTPGHSRAAILAMNKYAERTGDDSYLLSEPEDTSRYMSVQYYRDNAINVALPSTYRFIETVFDELIAYHAEAGVPLPAIHVGGDEVAHGAWTGSPACRKIMEERGWDDIELLKSYYIEKVLDIAEARGVKLSGWQEVVMDLEDHVYERLKKNLYSVNFWSTAGNQEEYPYHYANDGVPVVLSNMTNTYTDFAYTPDKTERGLSWGGFVDERRSFSLLPYDIYRSVRWDDYGRMRDVSALPEGKTPLTGKENIIGVQAQLWTETVRSFDHVTSYVFPKVCGVFERAWNASPSWEGTLAADDPSFMAELDKYYSTVVSHELPYYESLGIAYRHRKDVPSMGGYAVIDVDVEELSGLCFNADSTMLLSCGDQGVVKSISFDGAVSEMLVCDADMEGVTLDPATGDLYLAIEGEQHVYKLAAPDYAVLTSAFPVQEAIDGNYRNGGLEGVEYYKDDILFVGSQEGANLWQYRFDGTMLSKVSLADFATEVAGLCYEPESDWLWVMDSNLRKIFLCTPDGGLLASYDVPMIENAESVCVDRTRGCVWVGSDEDSPKLYRFDFGF